MRSAHERYSDLTAADLMTATASVASLRNVEWPRWLSGPLVPALVALVLGLVGIGDKSLWLDEAFSAAVARLPTVDLATYLFHNELHGSPYYLLLSAWSFLGTSEATLRVLSVLIGVLGVVATYYVGRRYGVAFVAALLVAVSPLFVQFEQNVRAYSLLGAWSSIATLAFLRYTELPTRQRALIYIAAASVMIYIHPIGAFVVAAHAIWRVAEARSSARLRSLAVYVPVAIAWLPMLRFMALHRDKISWIPPLSAATLTDQGVLLAGGALAAGAAVVLLALRARPDLPLLWLLVPLVGTIVVSLVVQPLLQARYLIVVIPPAAIIIARNRRVAVAALIALLLAGVYGWYASPAREDWRTAVAWMRSTQRPGDGVVFAPSYARLPLAYYGQVGQPVYPPIPWSQVSLPGIGRPFTTPAEFTESRIWLVETHGPALADEARAALAPYATTEVREFGPDGPRVTLYTRSSAP